jgi:hypothetical protein
MTFDAADNTSLCCLIYPEIAPQPVRFATVSEINRVFIREATAAA